MDDLRLGFVCSSGGGLIEALARTSGAAGPLRLAGVVTDRACGAEAVAERAGIERARIVEPEAEAFSRAAAAALAGWGADVVLLLFLRRVDVIPWRDLGAPIWNLHPSLLPRFRGFRALERSLTAHAVDGYASDTGKDLGVTLHLATAVPDIGPVIGQGRFPRTAAPSLERAAHLAFLRKLALVLEACASAAEGVLPLVPQSRIDGVPWQGSFRGIVPRRAILDAVDEVARPWARRATVASHERRPAPIAGGRPA